MKLRLRVLPFVLIFVFHQSSSQSVSFDSDEAGKPPKNFSFAVTGSGSLGVWVVVKDASAPSASNVLAQTDTDDTDYRFPVCVYDGITTKDVDVTVKFKAVKGKVDQAGGLVWRYQDKNNYYVVRANALEDNFRMYRVVKGKRQQIAGTNTTVTPGEWHAVRVVANGETFTAYFDGKKLFEANDATLSSAGKVGLWTKADSYTLFDDLEIKPLQH